MAETPTLTIGGRYRLVDRLASGGMGEVWRAHDEQIDRDVAVKLLRDDLARDEGAVRRFHREARMAASLSHPNVASIYDVVNGERPAIVMELVEGETLGDALARGPMSVERAVDIGDGVLAALEAAHASGIVHRDVTPGNVLLTTDGRVKVADFGIARADEETSRLTDTGMVMGTAHYLAPEQLRDAPPTTATDQYAAGLLLYEALTGARPFSGPTPAAAALARLQGPPPPLEQRRAGVPPALAAVVMRALAEDPAHRYESVAAMREALRRSHEAGGRGGGGEAGVASAEATVANVPVAAGTTTPMPTASAPRPRQPPRERRRSRVPWWLLAGLIALVAAAAIINTDGGPRIVDVPDLVGMSLTDATTAAEELELRLEPETGDDPNPAGPAPEGTVIGQSIPAATRAERGATIGVQVSSGKAPPVTVPNVLRLPRPAAEGAIGNAGLTVGEVEEKRDAAPKGTVIDQDPPHGESVDRGTAIDLTVSEGPEKDEDDEGRGRGHGDD